MGSDDGVRVPFWPKQGHYGLGYYDKEVTIVGAPAGAETSAEAIDRARHRFAERAGVKRE